MAKRLWISIPLFALGYILSQLDFSTIWKYLGITNQILACVVLWLSAIYFKKKGKAHWLMSLPAFFLTFVCTMYILAAPNKNGGLALPQEISAITAGIINTALFLLFLVKPMKSIE